ncbi:MAG: TOBE domain-containing protein, partial [Rhizobiaceae bacterium]
PIPRLTAQASTRSHALGVRPEHVRFAGDGAYRGRVVAVEYLGTTQIVTLDTPNGALKARVASSFPVQVGETVGLSFNTQTLSLFDTETGAALPLQRSAFAARGKASAHG